MIAVVKDLPPIIRPMNHADISAVATIESETYEYPWSMAIFRDCLSAGYVNLVFDLDSDVVGYGIMSVAAGEAHLLNICIEESLHGRGLGRRLLMDMLDRAKNMHAERIFLEVRPSNEPALGLYRAAGFQALGVRQGYYKARDGNEDAVVLVYSFGGSYSLPGDNPPGNRHPD